MAANVMDSNFRIEVPADVRKRLRLEPGHEVGWLEFGNTFRVVRVRSLEELGGSIKGLDWSDYRDESDGAE